MEPKKCPNLPQEKNKKRTRILARGGAVDLVRGEHLVVEAVDDGFLDRAEEKPACWGTLGVFVGLCPSGASPREAFLFLAKKS